MVKMHGPPKFLIENPTFPGIIISPQCKKNERWSSEKYLGYLNELYNHINSNFKVDTETIVLTGLSMGGYGSWAWAYKNPEKFLTVVPICGGGDVSWVKSYKNKRLWVFHGAKDAVVPIKLSEDMVSASIKAGIEMKFTVYPEATHDSWTETYSNREVINWMLEPFYGDSIPNYILE